MVEYFLILLLLTIIINADFFPPPDIAVISLVAMVTRRVVASWQTPVRYKSFGFGRKIATISAQSHSRFREPCKETVKDLTLKFKCALKLTATRWISMKENKINSMEFNPQTRYSARKCCKKNIEQKIVRKLILDQSIYYQLTP